MNSRTVAAHQRDHDSSKHDEMRVEAFGIGSSMKAEGLSNYLISRAVDLSEEFEGILDLLRLWRDESDAAERGEIVSDIQELIEDCSQQRKAQAV